MAQPKLTLVTGSDPDAVAQSPGLAFADGMAAADKTPADAVYNRAEEAVALFAERHRAEKFRIVEALLFAAREPLSQADIAQRLPPGEDMGLLLDALARQYAGRGVTLVNVGGGWAFRTSADLGYLLETHLAEERRLSRAALETLSIIAYHQPVTRAEIEDIRGVTTSKGSIDVLLETRWIRPRGRRRAPGRPLTYGTTEAFLNHFGLQSVKDLPGLAELKGAGLLDSTLPPRFSVPEPTDIAALMPDELALEAGDEAEAQGDLALQEPEPITEDDAVPPAAGSQADKD